MNFIEKAYKYCITKRSGNERYKCLRQYSEKINLEIDPKYSDLFGENKSITISIKIESLYKDRKRKKE